MGEILPQTTDKKTKLNSQGISKEISSLTYTNINYLKCLELDGQNME